MCVTNWQWVEWKWIFCDFSALFARCSLAQSSITPVFALPFFWNMKIKQRKIWSSYFISSDALVFSELHLNYSSAAFECTMHEMPITKSSACKYRKKKFAYSFTLYFWLTSVFCLCALFFGSLANAETQHWRIADLLNGLCQQYLSTVKKRKMMKYVQVIYE